MWSKAKVIVVLDTITNVAMISATASIACHVFPLYVNVFNSQKALDLALEKGRAAPDGSPCNCKHVPQRVPVVKN